MSKKINTTQIANELKGSSFFTNRMKANGEKDVVTSPSDITTSKPDGEASGDDTDIGRDNVTASPAHPSKLEIEKLQTVIKSLAEIPTSPYTTPVRLSSQEKKDIEDFIYITLRQNGLQGNQVSMSKLMRYCLRYLMKVHEQELVKALKGALKKDTSLPI